MTTCNECGKPLSTTALACPHCGASRPLAISPGRLIALLSIGLVVLYLLAHHYMPYWLPF